MRKWVILAIVLSCARAYSQDIYIGGISNTTVTAKAGDEYIAVYGGRSEKAENTSNNTVNMTGGTFTSVVGGSCYSHGYPTSGHANSNKVNISGGTVDYPGLFIKPICWH